MPVKKLETLNQRLKEIGKCAIAVSGGLDSLFLAIIAKEALQDNVIAISISTPYMDSLEIEEAKRILNSYDIKHYFIELEIPDTILTNPKNRCYLCKKELFTQIIRFAKKIGFENVLDGTNTDDLCEHRPGIIALNELGIISPLKECEFTKNNIRDLSECLCYEFSDKDSNSCLLTRLPYDSPVTLRLLKTVESTEHLLKARGFKNIRVRIQNDCARVEVDPSMISLLTNFKNKWALSEHLKRQDINTILVDIDGYQPGKHV